MSNIDFGNSLLNDLLPIMLKQSCKDFGYTFELGKRFLNFEMQECSSMNTAFLRHGVLTLSHFCKVVFGTVFIAELLHT